jgi:hypothetical protein
MLYDGSSPSERTDLSKIAQFDPVTALTDSVRSARSKAYGVVILALECTCQVKVLQEIFDGVPPCAPC